MPRAPLNRAEAERILASEESSPGARLTSALELALFEVIESAPDADMESLEHARHLLRLAEREVGDAVDGHKKEQS